MDTKPVDITRASQRFAKYPPASGRPYNANRRGHTRSHILTQLSGHASFGRVNPRGHPSQRRLSARLTCVSQ
eukprot:8816200-Pyramimonas_sp.AAC.1